MTLVPATTAQTLPDLLRAMPKAEARALCSLEAATICARA